MAADDLATQGARASSAMVFTFFSRNTPFFLKIQDKYLRVLSNDFQHMNVKFGFEIAS